MHAGQLHIPLPTTCSAVPVLQFENHLEEEENEQDGCYPIQNSNSNRTWTSRRLIDRRGEEREELFVVMVTWRVEEMTAGKLTQVMRRPTEGKFLKSSSLAV